MNNFEYANDELGELINCDIFGKNIRKLTDKFGKISDSQYYSESIDLWLQDTEQFGKEKVKEFIKIFFKIINESIKVDFQKTIDEITLFFKGDDIRSRAETISSYTEYVLNHKAFVESLQKKNIEEKSIKSAKEVSNALINAYSKGVEYISKIYSLLEILFCITDRRTIKMYNINRKTLYQKCNDIKARKVNEYNILVNSIDRNIRNADAHLNIYYNMQKEVFIYKLLLKGRWQYIEVPPAEMCIDIYPKVGWIIQGFIYTIALIIIAANDKDKYIEYINKIFN